MKVLVLALGNPILGDDGIAFRVLECLRKCIQVDPNIVLDEAMAGGIELITHIMGFDRVIIIDAIKTKGIMPGQVRIFTEADFRETLHISSPHSTNFATAMEIGRTFHLDEMPKEIIIVGIEVERVNEFTEKLTARVESSISKALEIVMGLLHRWKIENS